VLLGSDSKCIWARTYARRITNEARIGSEIEIEKQGSDCIEQLSESEEYEFEFEFIEPIHIWTRGCCVSLDSITRRVMGLGCLICSGVQTRLGQLLLLCSKMGSDLFITRQ
jgi:hypothetical protein